MTIYQLESVQKNYRTGKVEYPALRGIDLQVEKGEFLVLAGPSGSGKSTLLNLMGCLDTPTEGEIFLDDEPLSKMSTKRLTTLRLYNLGFVFQAYNLLPVLNVYDNVEFPLIWQKVPAKERKQRVLEAIASVGLERYVKHYPNELSGGQQQRVAIARALVGNPKVILADEPTANLDSENGQHIIALMKQINLEQGTTFIFSSHDYHVIDQASRVVWLEDGKLKAKQPTASHLA